jgi:hypothetical protein
MHHHNIKSHLTQGDVMLALKQVEDAVHESKSERVTMSGDKNNNNNSDDIIIVESQCDHLNTRHEKWNKRIR